MDSLGRGTRARRGRVSSNQSSARSSAAFDDRDSLHPSVGSYASHRLRPADSRFSLNEHFAATRREYEFGYDDTASLFAPSSVASESGHDEQDDTVVLGRRPITPQPLRRRVNRSYYELLCLSQDPGLSADEIRRAYFRLLHILQPAKQQAAKMCLADVQLAFETLIEPYRRADYDLSAQDVDLDDDAELLSEEDKADAYEGDVEEQLLLRTQRTAGNSSDVRVRTLPHRLLASKGNRDLEFVDLSVRQSTTIGLPALSGAFSNANHAAAAALSLKQPEVLPLDMSSSITVYGGAHGLAGAPSRSIPLLRDVYQPPGPAIDSKHRLSDLAFTGFLPALGVKLRQEFHERQSRSIAQSMLPRAAAEQEVSVLPETSVTARYAQTVELPDGGEPLSIEVCVQNIGSETLARPGAGLAVHRRVRDGTAFAVADFGDLNFSRTDETCRMLDEFSRTSSGFRKRRQTLFPNPPTLELGYSFSSHEMGLCAGRAFTRPADRGIRGMDGDLEEDRAGSWTASVGLTPNTLAAYFRYGKDLFSSFTPENTLVLPPGNSAHKKTGVRGEVEFGTSSQQDLFLAARALKRIGRFSKVGFEVGASPRALHLSLYWSRLGQHVTLPFLVATEAQINTPLVFWTTVAPFAAFAALEFLVWRPRAKAAARKSAAALDREALQEHIARRRAEADELTVLLAGGVEPRQAAERQRGGLVISSAKYAVRDAPPDEVADVTVAVAALVDDDGQLLVPRGLRKSRLLGFWDPAPLETKVLVVRYSYQGKEHSVEVRGRDELRLP